MLLATQCLTGVLLVSSLLKYLKFEIIGHKDDTKLSPTRSWAL